MQEKGIGVPVKVKRKTRSDKKRNVNPSLSQDTHAKLELLAISCGLKKTTLAEKLLDFCVNHPDIINYFQKRYNKNPDLRVTPFIEMGVVTYRYIRNT